jgi:hypothetical protein
MPHPTNEILAEKIDAHKELTETKLNTIVEAVARIEKHIEKQNGYVKKNTEFRLKSGVIIGLAVLIIPTVMTFVLNKIF